jgi:nondiscriminating glutamyl-tRNA synthetase
MSGERFRVRFAPSPTGLLHVGNARTALYNWLFARGNDGVFILRIEDTDRERSETEFEKQLIEDLRWLGLDWDEGPSGSADAVDIWSDEHGNYGPYRQSERLKIYAKHTERLLKEGKAYPCFCTPDELEAQRNSAAAEHRTQSYSGKCRYLSQAEVEENLAAAKPFAVRLKIEDHPLKFHDLVHGEVKFDPESVSDPVLVRSAHGGMSGISEGVPVYNYVVTIDDALMEITHVIRGDDHISNTPKQVAIYEAFGWKTPEFAHLSTILGPDRQRLSKRHGATSISAFREMGYLPEALVNYLALLGWGAEDGKTETFTLDELTRAFSLQRVTASPAVFDIAKLNWLNRHYLKQTPMERLVRLAWPYFARRFRTLSAPATAPATLRRSGSPVMPVATRTAVYQTGLGEMVGLAEGAAIAGGEGLAGGGTGTAATDADGIPAALRGWFEQLLELFVPKVDHLDQLPAAAKPVFGVDPMEARDNAENAAVLDADSARMVLAQLANRVKMHRGPVMPEIFKIWLNEIKTAANAKGPELFHPVRIAITGSHSGPEFDKLIPLIEDGAALGVGIPNVCQRVLRFVGA